VGGAPYDAFLAADTLRPALLEGRGLGAGDGRFTYATGRLVLWSPRPAVVDPEGEVLRSGRFRHLSLANPKLAPYGRAARQVLEAFGVWDKLSRRIVRGENVGQAFQFVASGNAQLGFVASSQLARAGGDIEGSWWVVPDSLYSPIQQQAILLNDTEAARAFLSLVRSNVGRNIIREFGYGTP
jgi:molybdate transport system substrate-binding protein